MKNTIKQLVRKEPLLINFYYYLRNSVNSFRENPGQFNLLHLIRFYPRWYASLNSESGWGERVSPWFTYGAIEFIEEKIDVGVRVFEFGSGSSTIYLAKHCHKLVSIEHDRKWYEKVHEILSEKNLSNCELILVEPEKITGSLPLDFANPDYYLSSNKDYSGKYFKKYCSIIDDYPDEFFDLIIVDGRARPSCIKHSIPKVKVGGFLVLDDSERDRYTEALKILNNTHWVKKSFFGPGSERNYFFETSIYTKLTAASTSLDSVKITFGLIVLNGEPFIRYNLRAIYPFAHEIIVVEGACHSAVDIARQDGHSSDNTLEILREFKKNEDPEGKITIVTAEDEGYENGFWPGEKDEMASAFAKRASGDYLWEVDVDEFYKEEDMLKIIDLLKRDPDISLVSFKVITLWGGLNYTVDGFMFKHPACKYWSGEYMRLFKWGPGYRYTTHRPPTVLNESGVDSRSLKWVRGDNPILKDIFLYHYSLVFPKQVEDKCKYYLNATKIWGEDRSELMKWFDDDYLKLGNPYRVHNRYSFHSWLDRYHGTHPTIIKELRKDIGDGKLKVQMRSSDDVESLLNSFSYKIGRIILKACSAPYTLYWRIKISLRPLKKFILGVLCSDL